MFLGVSGTVLVMQPSTDERERLAALIYAARRRRFDNKKAAYVEARINSTTWDRLENGDSVKSYILERAVKFLWPESEGDWQAVLAAPAPFNESHERARAALQRERDEDRGTG